MGIVLMILLLFCPELFLVRLMHFLKQKLQNNKPEAFKMCLVS